MEHKTTSEMRRKASEIFHCEKSPIDYIIKSSGGVSVVEPKESKIKTFFKSKENVEN